MRSAAVILSMNALHFVFYTPLFESASTNQSSLSSNLRAIPIWLTLPPVATPIRDAPPDRSTNPNRSPDYTSFGSIVI